MDNLVDRIYVHAKINALHGFLLSRDDYQEIVRSGKIHAALPDILAEKDTSDIIRTKEIVFRHQIEKFILFIGLSGYYAELFKAFLLLFELSNIKYVLSRAYGKVRPFPQWNDVSPYGIIDASFRTDEASLDELRSLLAGTIFSETMAFEEPPPYEALESRIDFLALQNLARFSRNLLPADLKIFNDILIRKTISLKIIWDIRSKKYYGADNNFRQFNPVDIFGGSGVRTAEIDRIEKDIIRETPAEYSTALHGAAGDVPGLESFLNRLFISYSNKIFFKDFHSICPVISYAWSVYYQILNLFTIIEGFHLKIDPDIIIQHVIIGE